MAFDDDTTLIIEALFDLDAKADLIIDLLGGDDGEEEEESDPA